MADPISIGTFAAIAGGASAIGGMFGGEADATQATRPPTPEQTATRTSGGTPITYVLGRAAPCDGTYVYAEKPQTVKDRISIGSGKQSAKATIYNFNSDFVIAWGRCVKGNATGGAEQIRTIWFNHKRAYFHRKPHYDDSRYERIFLRLGDNNQAPIPFVEDGTKAKKATAFRDTIHTGFEDFEFDDFDKRFPTTARALVVPDAPGTVDVGQACEALWIMGTEAKAEEIDATRFSGKRTLGEEGVDFPGGAWRSPFSPVDAIDGLIVAFDGMARLGNLGVCEILDRGDEDVTIIPEEHLVARETGSEGPDQYPVKLIPKNPGSIPSEVVVKFFNPKKKYTVDAQRYIISSAGEKNVVTYDTGLVLTASQARKIAKRRAREALRLQWDVEYSLPLDYQDTQQTDIQVIVVKGERVYVRVIEVSLGDNYTVDIRGVVEKFQTDAGAYLDGANIGELDDEEDEPSDPEDDEFDTGDGDLDDGGDYVPPDLIAYAADLPPLEESQVNRTGFFWGHAAENPLDTAYSSARLYWTREGAGNWRRVDTQKFASESPVGVLRASLPPFVATYPGFDATSTLDVFFFDDPGFVSVADPSEVLQQGANWLAVRDDAGEEWEIVGAEDVTPIPLLDADLSGITIDFGIAPNAITRSAGDWVADGYTVGMWVAIDGLVVEGENRMQAAKIATVAPFSMTFDDADFLRQTIQTDTESNEVRVRQLGWGYQFSKLHRGLQDTIDHAAGTKSIGNAVMALDLSAINFIDVGAGKLGKTMDFRIVPTGRTVTQVPTVSLTLKGESARPFRPTDIAAVRGGGVGDNRVTVSWTYNDPTPLKEATTDEEPPVPFSQLMFRVAMYADAARTQKLRQASVVIDRTTTDITAPIEYRYGTTKQQTDADANPGYGFSVGDTVYFDVWQVGDVKGKGNVVEVSG
jgi:hypothetical protein